MTAKRFLLLVAFVPAATLAQERERPGKTVGKVSVAGNLILMELDEGALGRENLFDLGRKSLRFTPTRDGYRVENLPLQWDSDFGQKMAEPHVTLHNFSFPFSGKNWDAFTVGITGSIRFGDADAPPGFGMSPGPPPRDPGGVSIGRFDPLSEAAANLVNAVPAICVFFKPRMSGDRYVKELADRVVVTWDVTEPYGNIQDFTWTKTINRFQAVLHKDGAIELSYDQLAAKDAIIGIYPLIAAESEKPLSALAAAKHTPAAAHLDIQNVKLSVVGGVLLKVTFEAAGPVLPAGDAGVPGIGYRVNLYAHAPAPGAAGTSAPADAVWTIRGFAPRNRANGGASRYFAFGPGLSRGVKTSGNTISIQGILPPKLRSAKQIYVSANASAAGSEEPVAQISARAVVLTGIHDPEVHLSSLKAQDGPFPVLYEAFHYYALPNARDMSCTVIKSLGDKFDFLAYYSDFRVDNQEAGTPSDGPLGAVGGAVTGIGATQSGLDSYCTPGRFQWQFIQPVYAGSNQAQERPPADALVGSDHDITFYQQQLAEISADGKMPPYMYAMSQVAHEMGHRWAAFVSAKVGNETIPLGPTHWARGLQAPVAFPYRRPSEASIMGGGVWQDNFDGTYTQLDDDYYVPATGWSYLDLYLMGLISAAEVPDFFILRNLVPAGKDANGHSIFKADRTKVTIQDVIAAEGPRLPGVDKSQRQFNTGMVIVVQHGAKPSRELIERTEAIRKQWIDYFPITTGHRASMTANPD
ncbi:MAG TPA: hypothetical protein VE263_04140 [Candidatus Angelobacter sp.]|nr:hypothetical protein [Candidatus Angelobacter sp.]